MTVDVNALKNSFARYATGVTVVSCQASPEFPEPAGLTVNSFTSVSLSPPLVLWCIDRKTSVFENFALSDSYAVTILRSDQVEESIRFSTPGNHHFRPDEFEVMTSGAPVLSNRLAALDCRIVARHDAGDHVILVGEVVDFDFRAEKPLMYVGRKYHEGDIITEEVS